LVGFLGERVDTRGYVDLLTTLGDEKRENNIYPIPCANIEHSRSYCLHATPGHEVPFLHKKFMIIRANQRMARQCYVDSLKIIIVRSSKKNEDNISECQARHPSTY
ncbi:hypothetical protein CR513_61925, partial [Mucuna pruriens]